MARNRIMKTFTNLFTIIAVLPKFSVSDTTNLKTAKLNIMEETPSEMRVKYIRRENFATILAILNTSTISENKEHLLKIKKELKFSNTDSTRQVINKLERSLQSLDIELNKILNSLNFNNHAERKNKTKINRHQTYMAEQEEQINKLRSFRVSSESESKSLRKDEFLGFFGLCRAKLIKPKIIQDSDK